MLSKERLKWWIDFIAGLILVLTAVQKLIEWLMANQFSVDATLCAGAVKVLTFVAHKKL